MKKFLTQVAFLCAALFSLEGHAQVLQITDFVMFSGNGGPGCTNPGAQGYGVIMGSSVINNGNVGAYSMVQTTSGASFTGTSNIYSGGRVILANGNTVNGRVTAANTAGLTGTIFQGGSSEVLSGNIDVNGNINISAATISGQVTHPAGTTYLVGGVTGPNNHIGTPSLPTLPALPTPIPFPAAGTGTITNTGTLLPNQSYGSLNLGGNKTITLNGPGTYTFASMNFSSNNNIVYNFNNSTTGVFRIYVHGDVNVAKLNVSMTNGGSATRIYWEIHGTGSTSPTGKDAFLIANGANGGSGSVKFSGTIYAPYAAISLGSGSGSTTYTGTLYSGTQVLLQTGVTLNYSYFTDCSTIMANAGSDVSFCPSGSASLGSAPVAGNTYSWTPTTGLSSATIANPTVTLPTAGSYTYTLTRSLNGCSSTDQVIVTVLPRPTVSAGTYGPVCVNGSNITLAGSPAGGTFSGPGVSGNTFNPSVAGTGTKTISYSYTNANGCSNTATTNIIVNALPVVSAGTYGGACINGSSVTLAGSPAGGTFSGPGVSGNSFNPAVAGLGVKTITYSYTNANGCSNTANTTITVNGLPNVSAGNADSMDCFTPTVLLAGSSTTPNAQFSWVASHGGEIVGPANIAHPTIDAHGIFTLTVTDPATGCSATDADTVGFKNCIFPGISEDGKSDELIGIDLTSLYNHYNYTSHENPNPDLFLINNDRVWVEIVYYDGMYNTLLPYLTAAPFNLNPALFVDNGPDNRIITTEIDIAQLWNLNNLNISSGINMINHVRPVYPAVPTAGPAYTYGDIAQKSDLARNGFGVDGTGIKIGVISDSYNTKPGNYANLLDVPTGELPGVGNPEGDNTPVQVIQDYPYGTRTDEGRAMMQIVHDVAPGAALAFSTGFISQGNMAQQIRNMKAANCDAVVDDITYPTSPFFKDGMISRAIREVTGQGMSYFTSAGNFGMKSCEGTFHGTAVPPGNNLAGEAHDFGGGDIYQSITLDSGSYLAVLQWEDDFYSSDQVPTGAISDLDWYLTYNNGITLFGMNRDNNGTVQNPIGGDPFEVLSFYVNIPAGTHVNSNILIIRDTGAVYPTNTRFKYVFFKCPSGAPVINQYSQGNTTIVGHANCDSAITVGAVRYSNTPAYGVTPTIASFSSVGGTFTNGVQVHKPDLCGPNGGNTTVDFGSPNEDPPYFTLPAHDVYPNFYGTSAAAPHVAGIGALMMQAKMKYYGSHLAPYQMKQLLTSTAFDMYPNTLPHFDYLSGYGLADADSALRTFAAPTPDLIALGNTPTGYNLGDVVPAFTLIAEANYITTQSQIVFRDDTLPTIWLDEHHLQANVPSFFGNPPFYIWTPPITPDQLDGGNSDTLYFFNVVKRNIVIQADNKTKKYGEDVPQFTATVTVDGMSLADAGLTLADLGLTNIQFSTLPANINFMSITGTYVINPEPSGPFAVGLLELYNYTFNNSFQEPPHNGSLVIQKMPLVITPQNKSYVFGDKINGKDISYDYTYDESNIAIANRTAFRDSLRAVYEPGIVKEVILVDDRDVYNNASLSQTDIVNLAFMSGSRATTNGSRATTNGNRAVANNLPYPDTTYTVDLSYQSLVQYLSGNGDSATLTNSVLLLNGSRGTVNGSRGTVNSEAVVNGSAVINGNRAVANGSRATANGSRGTVNGEELDGVSNTNTAIIIHETDLDVAENPDSGFQMLSINAITGMTAGDHWIIPGGFMSANFSVTYNPGHLHIDPYEVTVDPVDKSVEYGTAPVYSSVISGLQYDDTPPVVFTGNLSYTPPAINQLNVGSYTINASGLSLAQPTNYHLTYLTGNLGVTAATLTATADDKTRAVGLVNPPLTISYSGFKYTDNASVINPPIGISTTATPASPAGPYPITLSGGVASNYNIVRVPGVLTVTSAQSCSINAPASSPSCNSTGNVITATAPAGYNYSWSVSGAGWQITGGGSTPTAAYTAGGFGAPGVFTFNVLSPSTGTVVSFCTITVNAACAEYCAYLQSYWSNTSATSCNGTTSQAMLPGLLTTTLVNGSGTRQINFSSGDAACMQSKLPAGQTNGQLPNGIVNCTNATGSGYLNNGKFRSNLLGQEIALALSVRHNPTLGTLRLTGPYITTWAASACTNGSAVPNTRVVYAIPPAVITYLGTNNTVNDLIAIANQGLGSTLPNNGPSLTDIANACLAITTAFDHCRILAGFSSSSAGARIQSTDVSESNGIDMAVYPNPATESATISFTGQQGSKALIEIYSINGSLTSKVLETTLSEDGIYNVPVDCASFVKGIYFVRLTVGEETSVAKLVIIK